MDIKAQHKAAVVSTPLPSRRKKPQVSEKDESLPFSVRFTKAEKRELEAKAGGLALGTYIRSVVLDENVPKRRTRNRNPVKDHKALAQVLGRLGQSGISQHLRLLAEEARIGSLSISPETEQLIAEACASVTQMRAELISALGLPTTRDR